MKQLTTSKASILAVEVPEDIDAEYFSGKTFTDFMFISDGRTERHLTLPKANWQILGRASELTEEQAKGIVDKVIMKFLPKDKGYEGYRDYENTQAGFYKALQSWNSLCTKEGIQPTDLILIRK